jgi:drug/metabolite transporter (DMT)-like permease
LRDLPPITFASIRFILAFIILAFVAWSKKRKLPSREERGVIIKTGLLQFSMNYGLVFWGERFISSGLTAILQATIPLFGFLIAHYVLHNERLSFKRMLGLVIGLIGVTAIFANQVSLRGSDTIVGSVAILLGAFCAAYSSILVKAKAQTIDHTVLIAGQILVGLVPLILYALIAEEGGPPARWNTEAVLAVIYLAIIGTVVAFTIFYWLVKHIPVTSTQLISLVIPIAAVLVGVVFLNETVSVNALIGGLAIIVGVGIILWPTSMVRDAFVKSGVRA